jgi:succinate dehydrogenase/fumarate reductase cytochrome b subunit
MDTFNLTYLLVSVVYYSVVGILVFLSAFGIYIFIRYGRSRTVTTLLSLAYTVVFTSVVIESLRLLHTL